MKSVITLAALGLVAGLGLAGTAVASDDGCTVHYVRTACQGKEAESFSKCDGKAECDKIKPADSAEACAAAALKSCDNSRIDITKYKVITAMYNGKALVGGFDATGNVDPAGLNFCAKDRPDLNKCD
jgi:hypothetical protein